jgi:uncharacterized protein YcfL
MTRLCVIVLSTLLLVSCSSSDEQKPQEETPQERIGHEAAGQIKAVLKSAENAGQLQNQHTQQIEEAVQQNSKEQ